MKCPKCGEPMPMGVKFCTECGARMPEQTDREPNVRFEPAATQPQTAAPSYTASVDAEPAAPAQEAAPSAPRPLYHAPVGAEPVRPVPVQTAHVGENLPRMGWFKFLINFALWASAVLNVWNGIQMLTGLTYGSDAELVYAYLPALRIYDIACGVLLLACAAFAIFTRFQLARFRKIGPICLYVLYIAQELISIVYAAVAAALIGDSSVLGETIVSTITVVVMVVINVIYFRKRSHLFVN